MKVLWITNIMLPPISNVLGYTENVAGGWMMSSLKNLQKSSGINLAVATVYKGKDLVKKEVQGITWYLLPLNANRITYTKKMTQYEPILEYYWKIIQQEFSPDVIHIHGSEYSHGYSWIKANGNHNVVLSLQGIISVYARYYDGGIKRIGISEISLRDIIFGGIRSGQKSFYRRGRLECEMIKSIRHVIGRTDWDKTHALTINPDLNYYYCGETLRDNFYLRKWSYSQCEPYTIFTSQGSYPLKGLHKLIEALPLVLKYYPNTKLYVAGTDITSKRCYEISGYANYIKKLISRLGLIDNVFFTGILSESEMCDRYLRSNVFVCPSAIENSPNSLAEAQVLGMPLIASFVGGIPEIVEYNREILYRYEETEMLAQKIIDIFTKGADYIPQKFDIIRYDGEKNNRLLIDIYGNILSQSK